VEIATQTSFARNDIKREMIVTARNDGRVNCCVATMFFINTKNAIFDLSV
jgi:hypothetical protein